MLKLFLRGPYVGAGGSLFHTDRENAVSPIVGQEGSDFDSGVYLRAGVNAHLTDTIFIGVDYRRIVEAFLEYGGFKLDGNVLTARVGWSF